MPDPNDSPRDSRPESFSNRSLSESIIAVIAERTNTQASELEPLYNAIDPDALDDLFAPKHDGTSRIHGSVEFDYAGYRVSVTANNTIEVHPLETPAGE